MRFAAFSSTVTVVSGRSYAGRFGFGVDPWEVGSGRTIDCANACTGLRGDLLSIRDLTRDELIALIALARDIRLEPSRYDQVLAGKTLATIFEKPSLRTRVSFDVATYQLGGHAIGLGPQEVGLGGRESSILCAR